MKDIVMGNDAFGSGHSQGVSVVYGQHKGGPSYAAWPYGHAVVSTLTDGVSGFNITNVNADRWEGWGLTFLDFHGYGKPDDLAVGSNGYNPGKVFVLNESASWASSVDAAAYVDGTKGVQFTAANASISNATGCDMNQDNIDDLAITIPGSAPGGVSNAGSTYVLFGQSAAWASPFLLSGLTATNDFRIDGYTANTPISAAGCLDINGDGKKDLAIVQSGATVGANAHAGEVYVIYGLKKTWVSSFSLHNLDP